MAGVHSGAVVGVSHPKEPSVSVAILTAETQYWTTATPPRRVDFGAQFEVQSVKAGEREVAGHTGSPVGDRESCMQILSCVLPLLPLLPRTLVQRMEPPVWVFPPQSNPL